MAVIQDVTPRAPAPPADAPSPGPVSPFRSLGANVGLLVLLLVGLAVTTPLDSAATVDEGSYAIQSAALVDGSWEVPYRFADADPTGEWFPYLNGARTDDGGHVALYRQPAYPLVQSWLTRLLGPVLGLHLLPLLGAVGAAVAAWFLAGELVGGHRRTAFWLAALSPVLFNGLVAWAHAPVAALAGLAALATVRLLRPGRPPLAKDAVLLTGALTAVALLRSEGVLFAGALVAAAGWSAFRTGGWRRAAWFVPAGAVAAAAFVASRAWTAALVGSASSAPSTGDAAGGFVAGRIDGAWHTLVAGGTGISRGASLLVLVAGVCALAAGYAFRRGGSRYARDGAALALAAAVLFAARTLAAREDFVTGLLAAWPIVLLAGPVRLKGERSRAERALLGGCLLFTLGVLATQYAEGGGLEWGGRFLSPVLVPLAVVAAAGLARVGTVVRRASADVRRLAAVGIAGLVAVPAVSGVLAGHHVRDDHDGIVAGIERAGAGVVIAVDQPALPRVAWRTADDVDWLLVDDERDLRRAVATLGDALPGTIAVYGAGAAPAVPGWQATTVSGGVAVLRRS